MNKFDKSDEFLILDEASSIYTREIAGDIISSCSQLLENDLPESVKERIAKIDADCCRLIRNRFLISKLLRFRVTCGAKRCCSFTEVYDNCYSATRAICLQHGVSFSYTEFPLPCKINTTAEECALLLLLPVTLALEKEKNDSIRIITSKKKDMLCIEYTFSHEIPDVFALADECTASNHTSGLYFELPMLSYTLCELLKRYGGSIDASNNTLTVMIPTAEKSSEINSPSEVYIDNRFSLPYIMLSNIIKREI